MATYKSKKAYMYGTGRRKSSVARVHLFPGGTGSITVNGRDIDVLLRSRDPESSLSASPWSPPAPSARVDIEATVTGGGVTGQAGAIRHGIARALLGVDESYRAALKAAGYLTRESAHEGAQEIRPQGRPSRAPVQQALNAYRNTSKAAKAIAFAAFLCPAGDYRSSSRRAEMARRSMRDTCTWETPRTAGGGVLGHVVVIAQGYDLAFALGELRDGLAQGDALYYALRLVPAAEHLLQCEAVLAALAL